MIAKNVGPKPAASSNALKKIASPKAKPKRATSVSHIKLGSEPRFVLPPDRLEFIGALNWYNRTDVTPDQRADWVAKYMLDNAYSKSDISFFKKRARSFLPTWGHLARMITNNGSHVFEDRDVTRLDEAIDTFIKQPFVAELDAEGLPIVVKKIAPVARGGSVFLLDKLISIIDVEMAAVLSGKSAGTSLYLALRDASCNATVAKTLREYFEPQLAEFEELTSTPKDSQLDEGYRHLNKKTRKNIAAWLKQLVNDLTIFEKDKKKLISRTAKPRKPRPVKIENVIKHLKYAKESNEFKLASIDPAKIIGASVLWTFNTKTRQIGYFAASPGMTLNIKGTTIVNGVGVFKKSRKPELDLVGFGSGTKAALAGKFMALKTAPSQNTGRINPVTILMRVF